MKRKVVWLGLAAMLCASVALGALADQLFVTADSVDIRDGKSGLSDVVKTVPKGTALDVLSRDDDGWIQVQAADKEGYVYKDSLSPNRPSGDFAAGIGVDTGMSAGNASKGLGPEATKYASGKHMNPGAMNDLVAFSRTIKQKDLDGFAATGQVGKFKPAAMAQ